MYLATVDWATSMPSLRSSPCIRGAPHSRLARLISRISRRISTGTSGRPPSARLPAPVQPEPRPMPPDDRLRLNNGDGVQHRWEQAIEPNEEQSIGYCQPRVSRERADA